MYFHQPTVAPASTDTRAFTAAGMTDSRYSALCSSNHSRLGAETTDASMPSSASFRRASTATCSSDPVAMRITSGVPFFAAAKTYAPFATPSADA